MEQRLTIELKITKEDRTYIFTMPYGASHGEVYDVAHEILLGLIEMHKQQAEMLKRKEEGVSDGQ